ncbi:MAG: magnesium transporter CorA family protein, partial [Clostridiaceae bacterium]|nr:magnesium transporter CorA family protein [Clostridiaceae bacterium]
MIEIFKTFETSQHPVRIEKFEKGCWINIVSPSEEELSSVENSLNILPNFLRDPLDEEEKPRIDVEDNQTLLVVDIPYVYEDGKNLKFETIPLGILIMDEYFITICNRETSLIDTFRRNKVREYYTFKKTRFTLQILFAIAKDFLK